MAAARDLGDSVLPEYSYDIGATFLLFGYDRLDSAYFPKHGQAFRASWQAERESLGASAKQISSRRAGRSHAVTTVTACCFRSRAARRWTIASCRPRSCSRWAGSSTSRAAGGFPGRHAVRHRAHHPLSEDESRRHGSVRIPVLHRRLAGGRQRLADERRGGPRSVSRWRAALSFGADTPIGPLYIGAGFGEEASGRLLPDARQDVLRSAEWIRDSDRIAAGSAARKPMATCHEHNLRHRLPEQRPLRDPGSAARQETRFVTCWATTGEKEHWFATRSERDRALAR